MATTTLEKSVIDHIIASEKYRLDTFSSLLNIPSTTRRQLALAGFIYRDPDCLCPQCGISINLTSIDENITYAGNHFRIIHREKVSYLGKRCAFLLCESGTNIDDLHPPLSSQAGAPIVWDDAEKPDYSDYTIRLQTFHSWPHLEQAADTHVTPAIMATHGFYCSGPDDGVTCFYCGNTLTGWSDVIRDPNTNIVKLEHARFFPCRFITYVTSVKFVTDASYFHAVSEKDRRSRNPIIISKTTTISNEPQSIDECLLTFENWPSDTPVTPEDLAQTGFYYLGDGMRVKCFRCDLEVDYWEYGMTAFGTHKRRQKNCEIIQAIISTKTGDFQCANEKWRLQTLQGLSFNTDNDDLLWRELAACGFYRFKNTNNIRCAFCGVLIEPKSDSSIMSQHRALAKRLQRSSITDCIMVRANCPANITIPDRENFPEHPSFKSVFERSNTFDRYKERYQVSDDFIRARADAGFFRETMKRMRCFQCGNALPIDDKKIYVKYAQNDIAKLHAHLYPTCEWVQQVLGAKYVAQVLLDRTRLNEIEYKQSYETQFSSTSAATPRESFSSLPATPGANDMAYKLEANISEDEFASDDEGYEPVASPLKSTFLDPNSIPRIPSSISSLLSSSDSSSISVAQACTDGTNNAHKSSPIPTDSLNPFQASSIQRRSPPLDIARTDTSPIDPVAFYAFEANRLESFKRQKRATFADLTIDEIAYAGFYLNGEGTAVQCPYCFIEISEETFLHILHERPILPGSPLNDEPWTAMRVHRHEIGQRTNQTQSWCPWVRRDRCGLYSNVALATSNMRYPEYPSYSAVEKRVQSFQSDWVYPNGSRLSGSVMAHAGFIYLDACKVCCYYCGNRLCDFEPRDCPFEEHAIFNPLCDYIILKRGVSYIDRILRESPPSQDAKQKIEISNGQTIKSIIWPKSSLTVHKSTRAPVKRLHSRISTTSTRSWSRSTTNSLDITEDTCHICFENKALYEYLPCQHSPMCGECFAKLNQQQYEECFICRRPATVHMRVLSNSFPR